MLGILVSVMEGELCLIDLEGPVVLESSDSYNLVLASPTGFPKLQGEGSDRDLQLKLSLHIISGQQALQKLKSPREVFQPLKTRAATKNEKSSITFFSVLRFFYYTSFYLLS